MSVALVAGLWLMRTSLRSPADDFKCRPNRHLMDLNR